MIAISVPLSGVRSFLDIEFEEHKIQPNPLPRPFFSGLVSKVRLPSENNVGISERNSKSKQDGKRVPRESTAGYFHSAIVEVLEHGKTVRESKSTVGNSNYLVPVTIAPEKRSYCYTKNGRRYHILACPSHIAKTLMMYYTMNKAKDKALILNVPINGILTQDAIRYGKKMKYVVINTFCTDLII